MGHVVVDAELAGARKERVRVLVDTGATYSVLPADLAKRLKITEAPRRLKVRLADGRRKSMRVGGGYGPHRASRYPAPARRRGPRGARSGGRSDVAQAQAHARACRVASEHPRRARVGAAGRRAAVLLGTMPSTERCLPVQTALLPVSSANATRGQHLFDITPPVQDADDP